MRSDTRAEDIEAAPAKRSRRLTNHGNERVLQTFVAAVFLARRPFVPQEAEFGFRSSEWFKAFEFIGVAQFFDIQQDAPVNLVKAAGSGSVLHVKGSTHHSLLVEQSDGLVLVDAPLYEERQEDVLAEIRKAFPSKPIKAIVSTHFHYDHSGGIREAVAGAASDVILYTGKTSASFLESVLTNKQTVDPDSLQAAPKTVNIQTIESRGVVKLKDALREVQICSLQSSHSTDMLVVYVPQEKVLFTADHFNPDLVTKGRPFPPGSQLRARAAELYDETVVRHGLDFATVLSTHGADATASKEDLRIAAGR